MSRYTTQKDAVLAHLNKGLPITPLEALKWYGCFRLAAVIHKLREEGHIIETEMVTFDDATVARYSLVGESQGELF